MTYRRAHAKKDRAVSRCPKGCGADVLWMRTQYGNRVALDLVEVDADDPAGRYEIDWDAIPPACTSFARQQRRLSAPGRLYSAHFDRCPKAKPALATARAWRAAQPAPPAEPDVQDADQPSLFGDDAQ